MLSEDWDGPYVHLDGRGEVLDLPDTLEPLEEYFRSLSGEHPDWDEYRAAMARQQKCLIASARTVGTDRHWRLSAGQDSLSRTRTAPVCRELLKRPTGPSCDKV